MRKSAPDVRIGRGADRREPADARRDSELFKARHHRLPALRGGIKVNAVDRIEEIEWVAQLLRHRSDDAVGGFSPNVFAKMLDYVRRIAAQLVGHNHIIADAVFPFVLIADPHRSPEAMHPAQKRQT